MPQVSLKSFWLSNWGSTIAYDNATVNLAIANTSNSFSHTCTGSNLVLLVGVFCTVGDICTSVTYNGVAMTQIDKIARGTEEVYMYGLVAPATGANTVTATFSAPVISRVHAASYTGVSQTNFPDAHSTGTDATPASVTASITTVASNCWTVLMARGDDTLVASTGSTERPSAAGSTSALFDSNGPLSSGSNSMSYTDALGANDSWVMVAIAPFVSTPSVSTIKVYPTLLFMNVG